MLASTLATALLVVTLFVFAKDPRTLRHHCTGTEDPKVNFLKKRSFAVSVSFLRQHPYLMGLQPEMFLLLLKIFISNREEKLKLRGRIVCIKLQQLLRLPSK